MANSTTTLTIRIDEDLKSALEEAARLDDRSVTEYVIRAVKTRMAPQCQQCGRSATPMVMPAGLSPAMDTFLEERRQMKGGHLPVVITTLEGPQRYSYWGTIADLNQDIHGVVMINVRQKAPAIPVPRGLITGWAYDMQGDQHKSFLALGYANGNAIIDHGWPR